MTAEEIMMFRQLVRDLGLGLPENAWHGLPGLATFLESVSIERFAARVQRERGLSKRGALEFAAARVGVRVESHTKRLKRWMEKAWEWVNFD